MQFMRSTARRRFLVTFAACLVGLQFPRKRGNAQDQISESLRALMHEHFDAAREIGTIYLSSPERKALALQTLDEFRRLGSAEPAHIAKHFRALRHRDFSDGAIFVHHGWVFAEVEVRICAIMAIA